MVSYSTKKIFDFPFLRRQLEIFSCFYSLFFFWPEQSGTPGPGLEPGTDFILKLFHMYSWVYILKVFRDLAIPAPGHFCVTLVLLPPSWLFFVFFRQIFKCQKQSLRSPKYGTHECTYLKILKLFQYFDWAGKNGNGRVRGGLVSLLGLALGVTAWPGSYLSCSVYFF